ncbi:MAG TPA: plastocyanin/azurin family copper-binding protein, partial [Candidatus Nitrosocosmicus sp.]|nr:plastocyanin/azurin family copper-binding protein [Candidatus Nitrosocosmicus sp.]
ETGILVNNTAYYIAYIGHEDRFDTYLPIVEQMINSFKLLFPFSTNNTNSTFGIEESIIHTNQTFSNSTGFSQVNSNQSAPANLTVAKGEENLPLLNSGNESSENDKTVGVQITTITEKNGSSEMVNFVPKEIVVNINTSVIWTNNHSSVHTITSINNNTLENSSSITTGRDGIPLFDSDYMNTGDKFSYTFTQPGRFDYFDKNNDNLKGTVFVKQAPVQINNGSLLLDAVNTTQESTNLISNNQSENNETRSLGNLSDGDNPTVNSNNKTLSQLIQTLRQLIN